MSGPSEEAQSAPSAPPATSVASAAPSATAEAPQGPPTPPADMARVTLPADQAREEPLSEPITDAPDRREGDPSGLGSIGTIGGGGLGLKGVGEGGGGRPPGTGTGMGYGRGRGAGAGSGRMAGSKPAPAAPPPDGVAPRPRRVDTSQARDIRAGEWDDNANYRDYLEYQSKASPKTRIDVSRRRFLVVRDAAWKPIPNCEVKVTDASKKSVTLTTMTSGRAILFPRAHDLEGSRLEAVASCLGASKRVSFDLVDVDGAVVLELPVVRRLPERQVFDVAFVLDTTGSMGEEIQAMKSTLEQVAQLISKLNITARVGLVEYRDRGDEYLTRTHPMTTDVRGFSQRVSAIRANGGGDMPEHVNEGLRVALTKLSWSERSLGRLVFLIGDAPPQLDYEQDTPFTDSTKRAAERGIQLYTIAASGMDDLGQAAWRQMAMFTGGTNLFILRGGAGPQSVGAGDPLDSCGGRHTNYSTGNLAELITAKLSLAVQQLQLDPMRIAGLGQDENAKPCDQRVLYVATP
ncbi:MAG: VWA domain-containing protein [Polyangiaceae bacterium]|nr:VWA domain-containing protein [Polyangiaceae bacterium]